MKLIARKAIEDFLQSEDYLLHIEQGFVAYSQGRANIPPVGELMMEKGEVHIKYGYIEGGEYFVIKVASGFYGNPKIGLPSSQGQMMLFSMETGQSVCLLQDDGILTDHRTAAAGAIAAKYLAPKNLHAIGIIGCGIQAKLQALAIAKVTGCSNVIIWGRNSDSAKQCAGWLQAAGINASVAPDKEQLFSASRLVVTTTPVISPLVTNDMVKDGTLIVAMGSDTEDKRELDLAILRRARLIVDSKSQCQSRGEVSHLYRQGLHVDLQELGEVIVQGGQPQPASGITVVDLTGVAVQDLAIAQAVYEHYS